MDTTLPPSRLVGDLPSAPEFSSSRRRAKRFTFKSTNVSIPYLEYRRGRYRYFALFYYKGTARRRETRSTYDSAKARAEQIAIKIQNGETDMLALRQADKASLLRARELLAPTGKPLEVAAGEYTESVQILGGRVSLAEACRYYARTHPVGASARTAPQIAAELLERRQLSSKWKRVLSKMLQRFTAKFSGPLDCLIPREVTDWLDDLRTKSGELVSARTRNQYRAAIDSLAHFAQERRYLSKDWEVLDDVPESRERAVDVNLYTPEELVRLLNKADSYEAGRKLVPLIAITAFAGVRHGEMNEEKIAALDWKDLDFETKEIWIRREVSKTGQARAVDMPENLIAWLEPYRRPTGKICVLVNSSNAFCRLRKKAGITGRKRNALRKSFITYKTRLTRDPAAVADQAGNSPGIIRSNYRKVSTGQLTEAERWFAILPIRADVLPLFQWAKKT